MKTTLPKVRTSLSWIAVAALIAVACVALNNKTTMSPVWYGPYLSAAENLSWGGEFLINLDEVKAFREMTHEEQEGYRFSARDGLTRYIANPLGFAYLVAGAKAMFPWLSDVHAIKALQILLHVANCLLIMALLDGTRKRALFLFLYALNPLVIYFVTFPYYYFYQAIPSFALLFVLLARGHWHDRWSKPLAVTYVLYCAALALVLLTRSPTVMAVAAFFVLAALWIPNRALYVTGLALFVAIVVTGYSPSEKNFWHTAYVGIGAYPNAYVRGLSDNNGYDLYERKTGGVLNSSLGGNYYDEGVQANYRDVSRAEFMRIYKADWPMMARNATLNVLLAYTAGYVVGWPFTLHVIMAALGLIFLGLMLWTRQYLMAGLVLLTSITFVPYYPPITAYMYGAFALLVFAAIQMIEPIWDRWSKRHASTA